MKLNTRIIKELMVENGWNTKELAEKTGLSRATVSRAINGGELYPTSITKFYKAVEIDMDKLIDWGTKDE